jgi:hypothetical protein
MWSRIGVLGIQGTGRNDGKLKEGPGVKGGARKTASEYAVTVRKE